MNKEIKFTKKALYFWAVLFALIGACVAFITYKYTFVVRGILGIVSIYLTFLYGKYLGVDGPIENLLLQPKIYKSFVYVFALSMISYWATREIINMIMIIVESISLFQS
jgi:hypothetical protein